MDGRMVGWVDGWWTDGWMDGTKLNYWTTLWFWRDWCIPPSFIVVGFQVHAADPVRVMSKFPKSGRFSLSDPPHWRWGKKQRAATHWQSWNFETVKKSVRAGLHYIEGPVCHYNCSVTQQLSQRSTAVMWVSFVQKCTAGVSCAFCCSTHPGNCVINELYVCDLHAWSFYQCCLTEAAIKWSSSLPFPPRLSVSSLSV